MASTSSRRSCFSRRPPRPPVLPGGGSSGSMIAHCTSVVAEEGYTAQRGNPDRRSRPMVLWAGQDAQVQVGEDDTRTPGRWWRRHLPAYQESARPRRRTPVPGHVLRQRELDNEPYADLFFPPVVAYIRAEDCPT